MENISKSDIDKYMSLFHLIDEAFRGVRVTLGSKNETHISQEEIADLFGVNKFQNYQRAKSGLIKLGDHLFASIIRFLNERYYNKSIINDIKEAYDVYRRIEIHLSAKKGTRATNYISDGNISLRFESLLSKTIYDINQLTSEDGSNFYKFIDITTEMPFSNNKIPECINNCYIIIRYMEIYKDSIFKRLPENLFSIRISLVARIGAWASQAIGQRYIFNKFIKYLHRATSSGEPLTIIGLKMAKFHESNWNKVLKVGPSTPLDNLIDAYDFTKTIKIENTEHEVPVVYQNLASLLLHEGIHPDEKIPKIGVSTSYLLSKIKDTPVFGHYSTSNRLQTLQIEALSALNINDTDTAWEKVRESWSLLKIEHHENKYDKMKLFKLEGKLTQIATGKKENTLLVCAYNLSLELGAFQYSYEIADLMGWK